MSESASGIPDAEPAARTEMKCLGCGTFSSARYCWHCSTNPLLAKCVTLEQEVVRLKSLLTCKEGAGWGEPFRVLIEEFPSAILGNFPRQAAQFVVREHKERIEDLEVVIKELREALTSLVLSCEKDSVSLYTGLHVATARKIIENLANIDLEKVSKDEPKLLIE